jgi:hypothetical protein
MADTQPQKRRRPITICTECQRRKQKCDKQKPCGGCVARNVDRKCVYPSWPEHGAAVVEVQSEEPKVEDEHVVVNLADSLGYSSLNKIKGTLDDLQHEPGNGVAINGSPRAALQTTESSTYDEMVARLPSSLIIDDIARIFFIEADWYFCVLDRPYYEELYNLWKSRRPSCRNKINLPSNEPVFVRNSAEVRYFPALLFQVLALTLHFLPTSCIARDSLELKDHRAADKLSKYYSDSGAEIMGQLGRIDSPISAVLADLLRCAWMKNSGLGTHSWHSLSDAIRQAQNLDLHEQQEIPRGGPIDSTIKDLWYDEHRRRVWTSLFAWDAHMAVMLGRSRMIHADDCTAKAPMDCDIPTDPSQIVPVPAIVSGQPSMYTSQLFKYTIAQLLHRAMSSRALKSPCRNYAVITNLHAACQALLDGLPSYSRSIDPDTSFDASYPNLAKQRQQIAIIASAFFLAIHRPHATARPASRSEAIAAALAGLTAQQCLFELCAEHHYKIHTLVFYTVDAVIFLTGMVLMYCHPALPTNNTTSVTAVTTHDIPLPAIRYALLQAVSRFSIMRHRSDVAREGEKVLRRCSDLVARRERDCRARVATLPQGHHAVPVSTKGSAPNGFVNFLTDPMPEASKAATESTLSSVTPEQTPREGNARDEAAAPGNYHATVGPGLDSGNNGMWMFEPSLDGPGLGTEKANGSTEMQFDVDLPLNLDLDAGPLPDYLNGEGNFGKASMNTNMSVDMNMNMALWMEQNGFVDDALLMGDQY